MACIAIFALRSINGNLQLDFRSLLYGGAVGVSGAAGQLILFCALARGPAYIIFPIVCLSPVVTILLSAVLLGERAGRLAVIGIGLSLVAIFLLSLQEPGNSPVHGYGWLV